MSGADSVGERTKYVRFCRIKRVELAILTVLWDAGEPRTARDVFEELRRRAPWSYLTVRTTMTRMVEAGVVRQERRGRSNLFEPTVEREAVAAACVEEIINTIVGGELSEAVASVVKRLPISAPAPGAVLPSVLDDLAARGPEPAPLAPRCAVGDALTQSRPSAVTPA